MENHFIKNGDNKTPLRIAFGSQARVGKDTAADYLLSNYGGMKLSFSEPLYALLYSTQKYCGLHIQKDRDFLQFIGTWARNKDVDIWVNMAKRKILLSSETNIYVTDVRYPNEFLMLKNLGFKMVRIKRENNDRNMTNEQASHPSENSLSEADWDIVIENDGSLSEFLEKIEKLV